MKRDTGVNAVFFLSKKAAFTPASLFIFGQPTDVTVLAIFCIYPNAIGYFDFAQIEMRIQKIFGPIVMMPKAALKRQQVSRCSIVLSSLRLLH